MEPARHVEQIEIIEHSVTEGRRPISAGILTFFDSPFLNRDNLFEFF